MYKLLEKYKTDSTILSRAYKLNETHYLFVHKCLTYPVIVLSTFSSVIAGLRMQELEFVLLGLSLITLLFSGFNTAISPKNKEHCSNKISTEFNEIALNIHQFIAENNKTKEEIKIYSQKTLAVFEVWKSVSPEINPKFLTQARLECAVRVSRESKSAAMRIPRMSESMSAKTVETSPLKEIRVISILDQA